MLSQAVPPVGVPTWAMLLGVLVADTGPGWARCWDSAPLSTASGSVPACTRAQVVAAAAPVAGAVAVAVVVKLTRVVLLAPMVARRASPVAAERDPGGARPPLVPLFVAGFLVMVAIRSWVPLRPSCSTSPASPRTSLSRLR